MAVTGNGSLDSSYSTSPTSCLSRSIVSWASRSSGVRSTVVMFAACGGATSLGKWTDQQRAVCTSCADSSPDDWTHCLAAEGSDPGEHGEPGEEDAGHAVHEMQRHPLDDELAGHR